MQTHRPDVAVIGAGTAGLTAERQARRAGASTLLIDPAFRGTTCATVGCMPSKLLIAAADAAEAVRGAAVFGIDAAPRIDGAAVMARVRRMRDDFAASVRRNISDLPDGISIEARARFTAPGMLALDNGDCVAPRAVVIATGAAPAIPPPYEHVRDRVLTNESLFELSDLPASVGVVGAGPLGLELAQALARLGVRVAVFDAADRLAGLPEETSAALGRILSDSFPIHLNSTPEPAAVSDGVRLTWDGGSAEFERVLVAAGRPPDLDGLALGDAGLALDENGTPLFDPATMQCGTAPVFIAGDANHAQPVLHEASAEGTIAGRNAANWPDIRKAERKVPMAVTFTRPAAAVIGTTPGPEARDVLTGCVDFADQGRARVMGRARGLCRIHARAGDGRLLGASLCAPGGEHLAHLLAWAIQAGMTADEVLEMPFYHPTLEEGLKTALQEICHKGKLAHPWSRDDDPLPGM